MEYQGEDQCAGCGCFETQKLLVMVSNELLCQDCHEDYEEEMYGDDEDE